MDVRKGQNKIFMGVVKPENSLERDFEKMRLEKEIEEANKMFLELEEQKQKELDAKLETLEMLPTFNRVVILPYPRNPYRKVMEKGIIVDYTGNFNNPDSGEQDTLHELVACAKIIEVGPEVKYLKVDDDVFYDTRTVYPVPFLKLGYVLTSEPQILCVLNEGLKQRFNMT